MYLYFIFVGFFILIGANYHIILVILSPQSFSLDGTAGTGARILWMEGTTCRAFAHEYKGLAVGLIKWK